MTRSQTSGGFDGGSGTFLFRLSGTFNLMGGRGVPETCGTMGPLSPLDPGFMGFKPPKRRGAMGRVAGRATGADAVDVSATSGFSGVSGRSGVDPSGPSGASSLLAGASVASVSSSASGSPLDSEGLGDPPFAFGAGEPFGFGRNIFEKREPSSGEDPTTMAATQKLTGTVARRASVAQ